jgi:hypothetical protein
MIEKPAERSQPKNNAFKTNQATRKRLDPYKRVAESQSGDEDLGEEKQQSEESVAVAELPIQPVQLPPAPAPEPLPDYLKHFQLIPISQIRPGPYQKRQQEYRDPAKDANLKASMERSHALGLLHLDLQVMPNPDDPQVYYPAFGHHRRIEIAADLGLTELLCQVVPFDRKALAQGTYAENSRYNRHELNIIEEGMVFQQSLSDDPLLTQEGVAELFGIPEPGGRVHVAKCLQAARAMPDVKALIYTDPEGTINLVSILSQLDFIEDAVRKRAPIIEAIRRKLLKNAEQVTLAVKEVLQGREFSLDDTRPGAATPRSIGRYERAVAFRKGFARYFTTLGGEKPSPAERVELEQVRKEINVLLDGK